MAHILFVTSYYPPERGAAPTQCRETAVRLAQRGHQVTVLTTLPNYPTGVIPPEYRDKSRWTEVMDGVTVIRVWSFVSANKGFFKRILAMLSFGCLAGVTGAGRVGRPDVIVVISPPLFNAIAGRVLAWRKHCPFIFNVHDLWPESAVQMGVLHNAALIRLSEWLEWSTYRRAKEVWAVTEGICETLIRKGLPAKKTALIPNGVDASRFHPIPRDEARAQLGWDDRFTVMYAGTLGLAHGLTTMLDAAERLREQTDLRFLLVGEGAMRAELMADAARRGLDNVTFLPSFPHDKMPLVLAGADVCVVSLRRLAVFKGARPSKMFECMASARPVLLAVDGEAREIAEREAGAALYAEPENTDAMVAGILELKRRPDWAREMGERGRAYVLAHLDRERIISDIEARLVGEVAPVREAAIPSARR